MTLLRKPFRLGKAILPNNIFYAPLAGCSNYPYRKMSALYQPGLLYCEMVKMDALVRHDANTYEILHYDQGMHPIGAQLCGSDPKKAYKAAKILQDLGFDVIDLNCGCPVDKVTKDGSGSGLLKNPLLIGEILTSMVAAVDIPVTVKIRAGWDENHIVASQITEIAEKAGAKAICVHGRTRMQAYKGPANWQWIREAKLAAKDILVIGNGDVIDGPSAEQMFLQTGCDAVLVARGTMGNPWVAQDIIQYLEQQSVDSRQLPDCLQALWQHFLYTYNYQSIKKAIVEMRKIGCWYLKKNSATRNFRDSISRADSIEQIKDLILNFEYQEGAVEEENVYSCETDCV